VSLVFNSICLESNIASEQNSIDNTSSSSSVETLEQEQEKWCWYWQC